MAETTGLEGIELSDLQYIALAEILSASESDLEKMNDLTIEEQPISPDEIRHP